MPVTEEEAAAAVPAQGWLRRYVIHAAKQTTAPLIYHLGVGVSLLAVSCPVNYGITYAGKLRSNQFVMLVGRSGEDRKSSALGVGQEVLDLAGSTLIGDYPGSAEGLLDSLSLRHTQLIPISELGKFLSSAQSGYFEPLKTLLADLWDAKPTQRAKAMKGGKEQVVRIPNPRLSIAAACSIPYLEKHTLSEDWTGGFMGRWLVMYGRRERTMALPSGDNTDLDWLAEKLRDRAMLTKAGYCRGLDKTATQMWVDWFHDVTSRELPHNIIGIRARAPTLAMKVALAYGWDYGPAMAGNPWEISIAELRPAIDLVELHVKSLVHLSEVIAPHADARLRRGVLAAIDSKGGLATLGEISGVMKMRKRMIVETLDALREEGRVAEIKTHIQGQVAFQARRPIHFS